MTADLKDQVRAYTEFFVEGIDPVELGELVDRVPVIRVARPLDRRVRPRWVYGLVAAVAVALVVGGAVLGIWLFAGSEFVEQPATTTTGVGGSSLGEPQAPLVDPEDLVSGWVQVLKPTEPEAFRDLIGIPGGGFLALRDPIESIWSEDGVEWQEFDTGPIYSHFGEMVLAHAVAVQGQEVALVANMVDPDRTGDGWAGFVGHPRTGQWRDIHLDLTGLTGPLGVHAAAASPDEVIVLGGNTQSLFVWIGDPDRDNWERHRLPQIGGQGIGLQDLGVGWVDGRWLFYATVLTTDVSGGVMFTSVDDGETWMPVDLEFDGISSMAIGPAGIVAIQEGWLAEVSFSPNGVDWTLATVGGSEPVWDTTLWGTQVVYTEELGFVVVNPTGFEVSSDGQTWVSSSGEWRSGGWNEHLAVSGSSLAVYDPGEGWGDWGEPSDFQGIWLWKND